MLLFFHCVFTFLLSNASKEIPSVLITWSKKSSWNSCMRKTHIVLLKIKELFCNKLAWIPAIFIMVLLLLLQLLCLFIKFSLEKCATPFNSECFTLVSIYSSDANVFECDWLDETNEWRNYYRYSKFLGIGKLWLNDWWNLMNNDTANK